MGRGQKFYCLRQGTSKREERREGSAGGEGTSVFRGPSLEFLWSHKPILRQTKGFWKQSNFENFQLPLNSQNNSTFWGLLRGPWLGLHGPSGHYVGPHEGSNTRIVTK